jgi:hypothetical protein
MRPDISEFSYGYALTEELATAHRNALTAAPVFPSLIEEGKQGVGWDMRLELVGIPAFLQFKVGHPVFRRYAVEFKNGIFPSPPYSGKSAPLCYRLHLRAPRHSHQHASLVELENKGHLVYYVASHFHLPAQLNEAYLNKTVAAQSFWLRPSAVTLPDDGEHHVSYVSPSGPHCICSAKPFRLELDGSFDAFVGSARERFSRRPRGRLDDVLTRLSDDITEAVLSRPIQRTEGRSPRRSFSRGTELMLPTVRDVSFPMGATLERARTELSPKARAAYLTRTFFDAELMVIGPSPSELPEVIDGEGL